MIRIPLRLQERLESWVPACLRMVLAAYGVERTEEEIYACCETNVDGTLARVAADCARRHGLNASSRRLAGLDAPREQLEIASVPPIVYVHLAPLEGVNVIHAVIVEPIDVQAKRVSVLDPAFPPTGPREWGLELFEIGWRLARYQVILVSPG